MSSDPRVPPSDLPADQSDLVVEGRVLSSEAFLSNDKSAVYSEFTVRVSRVLKVAPGLMAAPGDSIVAERLGGRVRYPSGKIVRYRVAGEGSPTQGGDYLFFLKQSAEGNYAIVTAYGLRGNTVFALDGARVMLRGETIFDRHNGKDRGAFIEEVNRAVLNSKHKGTEVRTHELSSPHRASSSSRSGSRSPVSSHTTPPPPRPVRSGRAHQ